MLKGNNKKNRSIHPEVFYEKYVLKRVLFIRKETPPQVFSCEFYEQLLRIAFLM